MKKIKATLSLNYHELMALQEALDAGAKNRRKHTDLDECDNETKERMIKIDNEIANTMDKLSTRIQKAVKNVCRKEWAIKYEKEK